MPQSLRILAVDDEEQLLQLLKLFLTRQKHHVVAFSRAVDALEWLRSNPQAADLAIVDLTMPEMAGDELARELIALQPALRVLLSSGYPFDLQSLPAVIQQQVGFLSKPYMPKELEAAITALIP